MSHFGNGNSHLKPDMQLPSLLPLHRFFTQRREDCSCVQVELENCTGPGVTQEIQLRGHLGFDRREVLDIQGTLRFLKRLDPIVYLPQIFQFGVPKSAKHCVSAHQKKKKKHESHKTKIF